MKSTQITTQFKRYPAYKDSGVGWIDEAPEHWMVKRLASFGKFSKGGGFSKSDIVKIGAPAILYGDIYTRYDIFAKNVDRNISTEISKNSALIQSGDLLLTGSGETIEDIGKCIVYINKKNAFAGGDVIIYKQKEYNGLFISYCLNTHSIKGEKAKTAKGEIIIHTYASKLKNLYLPIPPLIEQTAISNFLDKKTTNIDKAIAQKEKLIALLKEQKQIIIQNAITRGLNPNVKMKDSSVDWIGKIPEEWGIKRFKYLFTQSRVEPDRNDGVVTSYRDGQVTLRSNRRIFGYTEAILEQGYQGIKKGQLVLNSMDAFEGAIGVSESNGKCTPEYVICDKVNNSVLPEYFALLLREMALAKYIQVICNAVRQRAVRIRFNNLKHRFIAVPPISVQKDIVNHIKTQSCKIDKAIDLQEKLIERLKEYKSILIDNAVTGKIKVC